MPNYSSYVSVAHDERTGHLHVLHRTIVVGNQSCCARVVLGIDEPTDGVALSVESSFESTIAGPVVSTHVEVLGQGDGVTAVAVAFYVMTDVVGKESQFGLAGDADGLRAGVLYGERSRTDVIVHPCAGD